jgi:myo-inositol 2-dehydrogenase / D-chiro-inositol 1-dehydrogenase
VPAVLGSSPRHTPAGIPAADAAPIGIGLIGAGRIGSTHARLLAGQVPGARVAAVNDTRPEAAQAVAGELGARVEATTEDLLGAADVDAVAICSSTDTHASLIVVAAGAGKPIFCEKPVSLELGEMDRALAAVEEAGVPFQIGFNRRFDPAHASVREAVADGTVGVPHLVRISSRDPEPPPLSYVMVSGGIFLDMTIHDFDMARFVSGSEVVEVYARGAVRVDESFSQAGDVDTAVVTLTHDDGCLSLIDNSRQAVYGFDQRVEVFGSRGMAASENPPAHSGLVRTAAGLKAPQPRAFFLERYRDSYVNQWSAFVTALRHGEPPPVSVRDARAPLVIGLAAKRSLDEGRPVRVEEVDASR